MFLEITVNGKLEQFAVDDDSPVGQWVEGCRRGTARLKEGEHAQEILVEALMDPWNDALAKHVFEAVPAVPGEQQ